jgi:hypothetical protein
MISCLSMSLSVACYSTHYSPPFLSSPRLFSIACACLREPAPARPVNDSVRQHRPLHSFECSHRMRDPNRATSQCIIRVLFCCWMLRRTTSLNSSNSQRFNATNLCCLSYCNATAFKFKSRCEMCCACSVECEWMLLTDTLPQFVRTFSTRLNHMFVTFDCLDPFCVRMACMPACGRWVD